MIGLGVDFLLKSHLTFTCNGYLNEYISQPYLLTHSLTHSLTYLLSIQISLVIEDYRIGLSFPFLETTYDISVRIFQSFQHKCFFITSVDDCTNWTSTEVFLSDSLIDHLF